MILVTGGAGFIGSNLHASLAARGLETIIVDRLRNTGKWRNLAHHAPDRLIHPDTLEDFLASHPPIDAVFHLGAISSTTADDGDLVWDTNVALSLMLWHWCAARGVRFLYASSAATYGDGAQGFTDGLEGLDRLAPLNLYGWSKHAFDRQVARLVAAGNRRPPQWAGLKFFNVYGPNEYHKGSMISVVKIKHDDILAGHKPRLFRADQPGMRDGDQRRDFIWVGDLVDVMLWLYDTPTVSGLFNLGTGHARTYHDLALAVCAAAGAPPEIEYIDLPERLRGQYQSYTEADMTRLRAAGYAGQFTTLEDGISRYVRDFLNTPDPYR